MKGRTPEAGKPGKVLSIFLQFLKFGCFTFGGGWSIVAQMQEVYVARDGVLSSAELLDTVLLLRFSVSIPKALCLSAALGFLMFGVMGM